MLARSARAPGPVAAGEAGLEEGPQVQCGAPGVQPGVVLAGPDVAEPDPVAVWVAIQEMVRSIAERVG